MATTKIQDISAWFCIILVVVGWQSVVTQKPLQAATCEVSQVSKWRLCLSQAGVYRVNGSTIVTPGKLKTVCRNLNKLLLCIHEGLKLCPEAFTLQAISGADLTSYKIAYSGLCGNMKTYLEGYSCYKQFSLHLTACVSVLKGNFMKKVIALLSKRITKKQYYSQMCLEWKQAIKCQTNFAITCGKPFADVMYNFEIALLPGMCKKVMSTTSKYDTIYNSTHHPAPTLLLFLFATLFMLVCANLEILPVPISSSVSANK